MPDVLIRHLRVCIVRKGSLFWGDDPRRLARRAVTAIPGLLADQLAALGVEQGEVGAHSPVRLTFRGTLASLQEALAEPGGAPALREVVRQALEESFGSPLHTAPLGAPAPGTRAARMPGRAPLGELLQLHLRGELEEVLGRAPPSEVAAYHVALLEHAAPGGGATREPSGRDLEEARKVLESAAARLGPTRDGVERLRQRISVAVGLAASLGVAPFAAEVRRLIEHFLPRLPEAASTADEDVATDGALRSDPMEDSPRQGSGPTPQSRSRARARPGSRAPGGATSEGSPHDTAVEGSPGGVLPDSSDASKPGTSAMARAPGGTKASGGEGAPGTPSTREDRAGRVATSGPPVVPTPGSRRAPGLALDVPPLEPSRPSPPRDASAAWDGPSHAEPPAAAKLQVMGEERPMPLLPLLAACVLHREGVIARVEQHLAKAGCVEELPLWVAALTFKLGPRPVRGWMYPPEVWQHAALLSGSNLFSGEGLVRLADDPSALWPELSSALVPLFVPLGAPLIAASDGGGAVLFSREPLGPVWSGPAESRALQGAAAGRPLYRHASLPDGVLTPAEPYPAPRGEELRDTLAALADRPACPLARRPHFNRHLGVAAGHALAKVGAALWPDESPPVVLMLERFATLEVNVRRDTEGMAVRVPLGKRRADLYRTGMLTDARRVPWLFGGSIRFRGG
ncbi:hypothetical protein [Pyxidicoccus xibeiensis]|uniref:hypothetical protein n=1 Tax=Pyxidicoccus xibeiensis TaxID=2906759 RepID=UPI0020A78161|nr:hypothetical protein [Pyxidicoccus xibeiensis]MCP3143383.1 hypothetical protein [Pyxidicoccus xibeiensis]